MEPGDLVELHYITPIGNVPSILHLGILSHRRVRSIPHETIAKQAIQDRRKPKTIPGAGRQLHEYANLYVNGRNPMMYSRRNQHFSLCILRVDPAIIYSRDVIIADGNASSDYTRFHSSPDGLKALDYERVFAEYWTYEDDEIATWKHKRELCAEVLVPDRVPPNFVLGAAVSSAQGRRSLCRLISGDFSVTTQPHLFFV